MTRTLHILEQTGWSEKRLADRLGVAQPTVHRLKRGQPESGPVAKLLDQLESDLAAGRVVPAAAGVAAPATGGAAVSNMAEPTIPSTARQAEGFASAHGGE